MIVLLVLAVAAVLAVGGRLVYSLSTDGRRFAAALSSVYDNDEVRP